MKAAFYTGNRSFQIREGTIIKPARGEVRLKIAYCGVCGTDLHIFQGHMDKRVDIPQVIGHEMSGEIVEIGEGVDGFAKGDRVVVRPLDPCGKCAACKAGYSHICYNLKFMGIDTPGAFQKFWTVPVHTLHHLPANVSMKQAALIEPISVATHDVRRGNVKKDDFVVVIGGGPIGMLIALVSKHKGAHVLLSEINSYRLALAQDLGIDAINPDKKDIVDYIEGRTEGVGADIVFEVSASASGAETMTQVAKVRGTIVVVGIFPEPSKVDLFKFFWRELEMLGARVYEPQDFEEAISLIASESLPLESLISEVRPLEEIEDVYKNIINRGAEGMKTLIEISS